MLFKINSDKTPNGDQPAAIKKLVENEKNHNQVLLGVTGSGKTFTIANVIEKLQKPTLIMCPNKTLAAQFYSEMKDLFPDNAVEYFVSYYDYYQPESYIARTDTYIEKEATINEQIDRMRHSATRSIFERRDVIIVASVSCIYGVGLPEFYYNRRILISKNEQKDITQLAKDLSQIQYSRKDISFERGTFRIKGDTVDIFPPHEEEIAVRLSFFGDTIEKISKINARNGKEQKEIDNVTIYPNSHYLTDMGKLTNMCARIREELKERLAFLSENQKFVEEQRLRERISYDIEMLEQTGMCKGIENYSRYINGRNPGEAPPTFFEYLPNDAMLVVDESHVSVPQVRAMFNGDRARKTALSEYGFRLPSCVDNRPLMFEEWDTIRPNTIFVSATPGDFELELVNFNVVEQIIRPTGLVDPEVIILPVKTQIDSLIYHTKETTKRGMRTIVVTLTKKIAEYLADFFIENGIKSRYLHSDVETLERIEILRDLRNGVFDAIIGINLLREGVDIPECGLVAVLDADKEGFLRSKTSIIQTIGRAARNKDGKVILFADSITKSIAMAIEETNRRRDIQIAYNKKHKITPTNITRSLSENSFHNVFDRVDIAELEMKMNTYAENLEFEKAAKIRDMIKNARRHQVNL